MKKKLVVYYSFSGNTRALAQEIADCAGADIWELVPEKPYTFAHNTATKDVRNEIMRGYCPKLASGHGAIDAYDTILVGSPNWLKSIAPPVLSFLRGHDFAGKTVVPFCTHGGGGFGEMEIQIVQACPGAVFPPGLAVQGIAEPDQVRAWLGAIELPE